MAFEVFCTSGEKLLIEQFQQELDEIENYWPMEGAFERVEPRIVNANEGGLRFRFLVYNKESEHWYGQGKPEINTYGHYLFDFPRGGDVVFDLGCNSGYTTIWYALKVGPSGSVHAFDPIPWHALATRYQARLNHLENVHVHPVGVGANDTILRIPLATNRTIPGQGSEAREISIESFSNFLHLRPNFLKIDIEGSEIEISPFLSQIENLRGGLLELHPSFIRERGKNPLDVLRDAQRAGLSVLADSQGPPLRPNELFDHAWHYLLVNQETTDEWQTNRTRPGLDYFINHINIFMPLKDFDSAKKYALEGVALYPESADLQIWLSRIAVETGDAEGAIAAAEKAAAGDPQSALVQHHLSWVLGQAGLSARSIDAAKKATELDSSKGAYWFQLSWQRLSAGDIEGALSAAARAADLDSKDENYLSHLARCKKAAHEKLPSF